MPAELPPLALYVHFPWCIAKCPYCDFNSHAAGPAAPYDAYLEALGADLAGEGRRAAGREITSIFLGGGTPSLFSPDRIAAVLAACRDVLDLAPDCEITMEANPGSLERGRLAAYRAAGVNRLSLGAQSFDAGALARLGRVHGPDEIVSACREAEGAGFDSFNVDLMFALPGQDLAAALADVERLIDLAPPHVSYYQLTLEPNTVFHRRPPAGLPDDDLAWDIQQAGHERLADAGYERYEISAFARPGHRCRHNLNYWTFGDYLAAGAGAHGKLTDRDARIVRYAKPANPRAYIEGKAPAEPTPVTDPEFEFMLNALRLTDGFDESLFERRTGLPAASLGPGIERASGAGLLEAAGGGSWRPTRRGFRFLNDLQGLFLP